METTTLWVKPVEGRSLPREGSSVRIKGPTPVPNTMYYRRALVRGCIIACDPEVEAAVGPIEAGVAPDVVPVSKRSR